MKHCLGVSGCGPDSYGPGCVFKCQCQQGGVCDPVSGTCKCAPGWWGPQCQYSCQKGELVFLHFDSTVFTRRFLGSQTTPRYFSFTKERFLSGKWGAGCERVCDCEQEASCHSITGQCQCPPGFIGDRCQFSKYSAD